nr:glucosaminidase domain-containing protein [Porphyromonas uenonis]
MKLFTDLSRSLLSIACLLLLCTTAWGQAPMNPNYQTYIRTYADECIRQMKRHKIPASITMAQGLIETGAGSSRLARDGNNHFGIKCHRAWQGQRIYADDDLKGECFRKYRSAGDSYEDHSNFLKQPRYKVLYTYQITDYEAWARGLQQCGYATNKATPTCSSR